MKIDFANEISKERQRYQDYLKQLESIKNDNNVDELITKYAIELYRANNNIKQLKLFYEQPSLLFPPFKNAAEYIATLQQLTELSTKRNELAEVAIILYTYENNVRKCNRVFENSILDSETVFKENDFIFQSAKEYIKTSPQLSNYITAEYKQAMLVSAISSLSETDLRYLAKNDFIQPQEISALSLDNKNEKYIKNMCFLYDELGIPQPVVYSVETKLNGVSFDNKDGSSRQMFLKQLKDVYEKEPQAITIEQYIYEHDNVSEPAANVLWDGKCIGALPATLVKELNEKYRILQMDATLVSVGGGGDYKYGCTIKLDVKGEEIKRFNLNSFFHPSREQSKSVPESALQTVETSEEKDVEQKETDDEELDMFS